MITITSEIKNIGYDGDIIRTFTFSAVVTHSDYPGVSTGFGGEPLVNLPRGTDLQELLAFGIFMVRVISSESLQPENTMEAILPMASNTTHSTDSGSSCGTTLRLHQYTKMENLLQHMSEVIGRTTGEHTRGMTPMQFTGLENTNARV